MSRLSGAAISAIVVSGILAVAAIAVGIIFAVTRRPLLDAPAPSDDEGHSAGHGAETSTAVHVVRQPPLADSSSAMTPSVKLTTGSAPRDQLPGPAGGVPTASNVPQQRSPSLLRAASASPGIGSTSFETARSNSSGLPEPASESGAYHRAHHSSSGAVAALVSASRTSLDRADQLPDGGIKAIMPSGVTLAAVELLQPKATSSFSKQSSASEYGTPQSSSDTFHSAETEISD